MAVRHWIAPGTIRAVQLSRSGIGRLWNINATYLGRDYEEFFYFVLTGGYGLSKSGPLGRGGYGSDFGVLSLLEVGEFFISFENTVTRWGLKGYGGD